MLTAAPVGLFPPACRAVHDRHAFTNVARTGGSFGGTPLKGKKIDVAPCVARALLASKVPAGPFAIELRVELQCDE